MKTPFTRRDALKLGMFSATAAALSPLNIRQARAQAQAEGKLLFVIAAGGGASIVDGLLPVSTSEGNGGAAFDPAQITQPNGSNLRCPVVLDNSIQGAIALGNQYPVANFLQKHAADTAVMTQEGTSVNHLVAAKRCVSGNNINKGRTLMEAMAMAYGADKILPNANMAGGGYLEPGDDVTVPDAARSEPIADARLFAFSTHGTKGVSGAPSARLIAKARQVRKDLEEGSGFGRTFRRSPLLQTFLSRRETVLASMESADLITKLMLFTESADSPLSEYDLESSPDGQVILDKFPTLLQDPFEAQAALGFLLARYGVSSSITLGPGTSPVFEGTERIINPPIAFDWSHNDHRGAQNSMWSRLLKTLDGLIDLLKQTDYLGNPENGKMWDRSLIFVATEFGRDKTSSGGSGHHLNNGNVLISPLLVGNRVYGGVDPNTCLTHGFDPQSGDPQPDTVMREGDVYSAVCHALGVDFPGRRDFPCMVR